MRRSPALGLLFAVVLVFLAASLVVAASRDTSMILGPDGDGSDCARVWQLPCTIGLVEDIDNRVVELELEAAVERSLRTKLAGAIRSIARENVTSAVGHMRAFQGAVRAHRGVGRAIFIYTADSLVAQAEVVIQTIIGFAPGPIQTDNLAFLGGSVTEHPKVYITSWGWGSAYSAAKDPDGVVPILEGFLSEIGGTPYLDPLEQYYGREYDWSPFGGATVTTYYIQNDSDLLKGIWYDSDNAMPTNPSTEDIQKEVRRSAAHFGYNEDAIYYVVTPPGRTWNIDACAYHSSTHNNDNTPSIIYVDLPYQPEVCQIGLTGAEATTVLAFHELIEAMTDPRYGDKPSLTSKSFAWVAPDGRENADKCGTLEGYPQLDIVLGGETYTIQAQWSNAHGACIYF